MFRIQGETAETPYRRQRRRVSPSLFEEHHDMRSSSIAAGFPYPLERTSCHRWHIFALRRIGTFCPFAHFTPMYGNSNSERHCTKGSAREKSQLIH
jgi:hypothetical protein